MDIHRFIKTLRRDYRQWGAPMITALANAGATPFQVLISTVLSLRTKDAVTATMSCWSPSGRQSAGRSHPIAAVARYLICVRASA